VIPWHLGAAHPIEQALTIALALGPFLVLAIVIVIRRRMDRLEDERNDGPGRDVIRNEGGDAPSV
jgi:hypothetical protein